MSYSDFDLRKVKTIFNLTLIENESLFANVPAREISPFLAETLAQNVPLALAIATKKASSELIIVNLFLELKRLEKMSFFSGIEFNVDKEQGLNGFCDFIISNSTEQFFLESPVVFIAEAKNERINSGLGQCIAEMVAAQLYNERENQPRTAIYGAVTTGHVWKFLKYENQQVHIDCNDFYIDRPDKIMGILAAMVRREC
jgi:hypothetical protein